MFSTAQVAAEMLQYRVQTEDLVAEDRQFALKTAVEHQTPEFLRQFVKKNGVFVSLKTTPLPIGWAR